MDKLLREPGYQSDTLGDVQEFLKEMLEMYHYEETLMNSTTQAIHSDIHDLQLQLQKQKKQGFPIHSLGCGLCGEHVAKKCGKIFKFTYVQQSYEGGMLFSLIKVVENLIIKSQFFCVIDITTF